MLIKSQYSNIQIAHINILFKLFCGNRLQMYKPKSYEFNFVESINLIKMFDIMRVCVQKKKKQNVCHIPLM